MIPPETMTGSYELRDLGHPAVGLLYEGKLTIDKTYGHASYGCGTCCGYYNTRLTPNPYSGPPSVYNQDYYLAQEQCGGYYDDFTGSAYSWYSTNSGVASLPNSMLHTVAVGTATGSAQNLLQATHPAPRCPQAVMGGSQPVTVAPKPVITNIIPANVPLGSSNLSVEIDGNGFGSAPTVQLPSGFRSSGQGSTDTKIVIMVSVDYSPTVGPVTLTVTNTTVNTTSNPYTFVADGPHHFIVQNDQRGTYGNSSNVYRLMTYEVANFSGTPAANIQVGEVVNDTGWTCNQGNPGTSSTACSANFHVNSAGVFQDQWSLGGGTYTPSGCGTTGGTDAWQWCTSAGAKPLTTLNGWLHTDAINLNGVVNPPNTWPQSSVFSH
jgi:hypothetical protein